jgi:hypothetical protein
MGSLMYVPEMWSDTTAATTQKWIKGLIDDKVHVFMDTFTHFVRLLYIAWETDRSLNYLTTLSRMIGPPAYFWECSRTLHWSYELT